MLQLCEPGAVVELRIIGRGIASGYFDALDVLARDAAQCSDRNAEGVYITLNPVNAALLSRSPNAVRERAKHTTSDADVLRRARLLVDLDPQRPAGISATEDEHAAALVRARDVRDWLAARDWPAGLLADSGNGAHLVYALDLPNDAAATALVKRALDALALEFGDERVSVDRTTYNAARISKLYGTVTRKGADTPERPHRVARILTAPGRLAVVPREALSRLAALVPPAPDRGAGAGPTGRGYTVEALDAVLAARGLSVSKRKAWGDGATLLELAQCPWGGATHPRAARLVVFDSGAVSARCFHNSCADRGWRDLRELLGLAPVTLGAEVPTSNIWSSAKTAGELLAAGTPTVEWLDFPLVARGSLTAIVRLSKGMYRSNAPGPDPSEGNLFWAGEIRKDLRLLLDPNAH